LLQASTAQAVVVSCSVYELNAIDDIDKYLYVWHREIVQQQPGMNMKAINKPLQRQLCLMGCVCIPL